MLQRIKTKIKAAWLRFKKWAIGLLAAIGIVIGGGLAMADDVNLSWINATEWEDGTPLGPLDLVETVIGYQAFALGTDISTATWSFAELDRVSATQTAYLHANVFNGIHCYVAYHIAINGQRSKNSNVSCKVIDVRLSGAPSSLEAT